MSKSLGGVLQGNETVFLTQDEINNPYANIPTMIEDKKRKQVQMKQTIFDRITASLEALAEKLVYQFIGYDGNGLFHGYWKSAITDEEYTTKEKAIAATVARLKEVEE